jgi:branched-chain amino acid transport system permease protein
MLATLAIIFGLGSMYGLLARGFHVTYTVSSTVNFAQGSAMMLGAVLCYTFVVTWRWNTPVSIGLTLLLCAVWGILVERFTVRPFVRRGSTAWLMATLAVRFTFGREPRSLLSPLARPAWSIGGLGVSPLQILIPLLGLCVALALSLVSHWTWHGKAWLAVVQNRDAAQLMGINVTGAVAAAYALSSVFAGTAGMLIAPLFNVSSDMGTLLRQVLRAGIAVVLVAHNMQLVMGVSDAVVVLDAGWGLAVGNPAQVRQDEAVRKAYLGECALAGQTRRATTPGVQERVLTVQQLSASYGAASVLEGIDLAVQAGELVAIQGGERGRQVDADACPRSTPFLACWRSSGMRAPPFCWSIRWWTLPYPWPTVATCSRTGVSYMQGRPWRCRTIRHWNEPTSGRMAQHEKEGNICPWRRCPLLILLRIGPVQQPASGP